jgi:alpha-tubulin suppressor-like RCC1 family protein
MFQVILQHLGLTPTNQITMVNSMEGIECWGRDTNGESTPPSGVFAQIAAGGNHTCAMKNSGMLECWGLGTNIENCPNGSNCAQSFVEFDFDAWDGEP